MNIFWLLRCGGPFFWKWQVVVDIFWLVVGGSLENRYALKKVTGAIPIKSASLLVYLVAQPLNYTIYIQKIINLDM